jgi:glycosyltransferase involved in cell wall biosynthesis
MKEPEVSVVVATYNRCEILPGTLESLINQEGETAYEVIVVDNNSTDDTRHAIEKLRAKPGYEKLTYYFEEQQGVSHARNRGISHARASIIAFTDDDIRPAKNWISSISKAFKQFPEADCIGGKVLPHSETKFPAWLTDKYWTPLALLDLGSQPLQLNVQKGAGLVAANLAVRASVFKDVGLFHPQLQRVKNSVGSMEDHEFQLRLSAAKKRLMYVPDLVVYAHVLEERLTKDYHRRWYCGHGHFYAVMRDAEFESSKIRLFDVPSHLYRRTCSDAFDWLKHRLRSKSKLEFQQELEMYFFWGFFRKRFADRRSILELGKQGPGKRNEVPQ